MIHGRSPVTVWTGVGDLHVSVVGSGPPALLWHSLFVDSSQWSRVRAALAAHRTLLLVDGPGHGSSGPPAGRFTLEDCATAAARVLDELDVPGPVDWLGNAWGGHIGLVFAATRPTRTQTVTAIAAPVRPLGGIERARIIALLTAYRLAGPVRPLAAAIADTMLAPEVRRTDPSAEQLVLDAFRTAPRTGMCRAMRSAMLDRQDLTSLLGQIPVPALLIAGADDAMWTPAQADAAAGMLTAGKAVAIRGTRHLPPLEAPAEVASCVLDFWHSHREPPDEAPRAN